MIIPLAAILGMLFFISEKVLAWRRHSSKVVDGKNVDGGTLRLLWVVIMSSVAASVVVAFWPLGPRLPEGFPWGGASFSVFALGTILRWWAIVHLGRFFTVDVTVAEGQSVIDTGPYRWMRHPSYTGLLMQFAGLALSLDSWLALPVMLVPIFVALLQRIRTEEAALCGALGASYTTYCLRTKRLIPLVY